MILSKNADVLEAARFLSSSRNQSGRGHIKQQCDFWSYHCFYLNTCSQETSLMYSQSVSGAFLFQRLEQWDTSSLQQASLL